MHKRSIPSPCKEEGDDCMDARGRATQEQLPRMGVIENTVLLAHPHPGLPPCRGKGKKSLVKVFGVVGLRGHKTATTPSAARPPLLENKEGRGDEFGLVCGMCGFPRW